ncbi:MAG: M15 family metallopeptidase [Defluviitaleaceae bacterium]|nr:M15 family metallopeptidase [Defluviitaleaceae bacterium]
MRKLKTVLLALLSTFVVFAVSFGLLFVINGDFGTPVVAVAQPFNLHQEAEEEPEPEQEVYAETNPTGGNTLQLAQTSPAINEAINDIADLPWNLTLVNRYNFLPADFAPPLSSIGGGHYFDARAADSLVAMLDSARSQGLAPLVVSSHRSIAHQTTLFTNQLNRRLQEGMSHEDAFDAARRVVAYPGSSEHNLGLAVDIVANNYRNLTAAFGQTPEGIWLAQNSWRYGFVLRYPYHKQDITHIIYEPWHFRYVGAEHATTMFELDLVLEEYIEQILNN